MTKSNSLPPIQPRYLRVNGVQLHVVEAGPQHAPLVILLHGFPEFWYGWRKQIGPLVQAGYRVWAVDQRGYNLSEKPDLIEHYSLDNLAADVYGLIETAGRQQVSIVGHDWGGAVAWHTALRYPARLNRLVVLNCPHGAVMRDAMKGNFQQMLRSWYIYFFQIPWLAETLFERRKSTLANSLRRTSSPGAFSEEDLVEYRRAWDQEGAIPAMINWYRAIRQFPPQLGDEPVQVPTLLIWGAKDRFLGAEMAEPSIRRCVDGRLEVIEEATHWVQHDCPDRVNSLVDGFLRMRR